MNPEPIQLNELSAQPLVSIVTPCYNAATYISLTIESVLAQSYENWEMVICDDGSTDESATIIESYAATDPRIRLFSQENSGAAAATNAAYEATRGEIIAFLDADDLFAPEKLEACVNAFQERPDSGFLTHRLQGVDHIGKDNGMIFPGVPRLVDGWFAPHLFDKAPTRGSSAPSAGNLVRREALEKVMPIPTECPRTQDAYVLTCAMLLTPAIGLDKVLGSYRIHPGGQSRGSKYTEAFHARRVADLRASVSAIARFCRRMEFCDLAEYLEGEYYYENRGYLENVAILYLLTGGLPEDLDRARIGEILECSGKYSGLYKCLGTLPLVMRRIFLRCMEAFFRKKSVFKRKSR